VLAAALEREEPDLVLFGQQASDSDGAVLWAAVADRLRRPLVSQVAELTRDDGKLRGKRQTEYGYDVIEAPLPAVIAVSDAINEPRYPSLKGIMGAKKKPQDTVSLGDLGIEPDRAGDAGSRTRRPLPHPARTLKERREGDVNAERAFRRTPRSVLLRWRRAAADERAKEVRPVRTHPPAAGIAGIARAEHRHRCARPADGGRQDQLERTMVRERVGRRERLVAESLTDDVDEAPFRSRRSAVRADGQEQRERDRYRQCMPHVFLLVAKMSRP